MILTLVLYTIYGVMLVEQCKAGPILKYMLFKRVLLLFNAASS
jgi:hypothetical protein